MRHRLITWFFWEGFPILFQGIREVFISNMSINIHDFSWYYKNTSKFQWTVICIILKKPVTLKIKNKPLSDFNMWNYSLNNYIMVTYRVVWHQWQTPPLDVQCTRYITTYLTSLMENKYQWFLPQIEGILLSLSQQPSKTWVHIHSRNKP